MQLTMFAPPTTESPALSFGKMCRAYSAHPTTHLAASLAHSLGPGASYSRQGEGGQTLVLCLDPAEQSRGASSTPNTSAGRRIPAHAVELK